MIDQRNTKDFRMRDRNPVKLKSLQIFRFKGFFLFFGGLDGTRTRDPMRDRHVF